MYEVDGLFCRDCRRIVRGGQCGCRYWPDLSDPPVGRLRTPYQRKKVGHRSVSRSIESRRVNA